MKSKNSYGIALCRYNKEKNNAVELLLVKKKVSYYFIDFVMAHYRKNDVKYLKYMFDNMSFSEKMDILSLRFEQIWYRAWGNIPEKHFDLVDFYKQFKFTRFPVKERLTSGEIYKMYFQKKNKFENNFLKDNGRKLRSIIQQSTDCELIWEIPKGSIEEDEKSTDCAIREFYEETSIKYDKYKILYHLDPIVISFIDNNVLYKTVYYIAVLREPTQDLTPRINFLNYNQICEIEAVKWVSLQEIKFLQMNKKVQSRLINMYKKIIKRFKNYNSISFT